MTGNLLKLAYEMSIRQNLAMTDGLRFGFEKEALFNSLTVSGPTEVMDKAVADIPYPIEDGTLGVLQQPDCDEATASAVVSNYMGEASIATGAHGLQYAPAGYRARIITHIDYQKGMIIGGVRENDNSFMRTHGESYRDSAGNKRWKIRGHNIRRYMYPLVFKAGLVALARAAEDGLKPLEQSVTLAE